VLRRFRLGPVVRDGLRGPVRIADEIAAEGARRVTVEVPTIPLSDEEAEAQRQAAPGDPPIVLGRLPPARLGGKWCLVREHVEAIDIATLCEAGRVPAGPALEIIATLAHAIAGRPRDAGPIRAADILITPRGEVRALELGSGDTRALGAVLFRMMTGRSLPPLSEDADQQARQRKEASDAVWDVLPDLEFAEMQGCMVDADATERPPATEVARICTNVRRDLDLGSLAAWAEQAVAPIVASRLPPVSDEAWDAPIVEEIDAEARPTEVPDDDLRDPPTDRHSLRTPTSSEPEEAVLVGGTDPPTQRTGGPPPPSTQRTSPLAPPSPLAPVPDARLGATPSIPPMPPPAPPEPTEAGFDPRLLAPVAVVLLVAVLVAAYSMSDGGARTPPDPGPTTAAVADVTPPNPPPDPPPETTGPAEAPPTPPPPVETPPTPPPPVETPPTTPPTPPTTTPTTTRPALATVAPEPSPPDEPREPVAGDIRVSGDATTVMLVGPDGRTPVPGLVPPGRYSVEATFEGTDPMPAGEVEVKDGAHVELVCSSMFGRCTAK
jgi:hypothetical protein